MAGEKTQHNADCGNAEHGKHLCFLMYEGYHLNNKEAYKALVRDAEFRCQKCGRTAKAAGSLCEPVPL
jgi:hypothetical protein